MCLKPSIIKFGSQNQKLFMFKSQYQNGKKQKSRKRFPGLKNGAIRGIQIGAGFRDYKSGQEGLQIGAALVISNRDKKITNWAETSNRCKKILNRGKDYKSDKKDFKSVKGLQVGEKTLQTCN